MGGAGVYYIYSNENSTQTDDRNDTTSDFYPQTSKWTENEEIKILREYLRIPTVSLENDFGKSCL